MLKISRVKLTCWLKQHKLELKSKRHDPKDTYLREPASASVHGTRDHSFCSLASLKWAPKSFWWFFSADRWSRARGPYRATCGPEIDQSQHAKSVGHVINHYTYMLLQDLQWIYFNTQQNQYNARTDKTWCSSSKKSVSLGKCDQMSKERPCLAFILKLDAHARKFITIHSLE